VTPPEDRHPFPLDAAGETTIAFVQRELLAWFGAHGRDLPWRHTRDPYRILVSEVMLQQVQVARAIPFYLAFIDRFPTVHDLAVAPIADVIRVWADLGRYRRIAYLHRTAREIVDRFAGQIPADVETLKTLPGIGPYTAGAVACFAFEQDVAFVDTNVRRVIDRLFFGTCRQTGADVERQIATLAERLVPPGRGWDWNQGLIDFGATVCTARRPRCELCPLRPVCRAHPAVLTHEAAPTNGKKPFVFAGSNRFYRGRILAELRQQSSTDPAAGIPLPELGARVRPEFAPDDLPWLYDVVTGLEKDGLARIAEERPAYDASESPDTAANAVTVRLP
jgi:A/G-specific adenine glycosylase